MSSIPKTPVSIDSEKALLGSLIIDSESWEKISNLITPTDFYDVKNRDIFSEIYALQINDQPIDILILEEALKSRDKLSKVGGIEYLKDLAKTVPTSAHIVKYAEIVREKSVMRKLIEASTRTIESIHDDATEDVRAILDKAEADIFSIASDTKKNEAGGLSGKPLKSLSTKLIQKFFRETKSKIQIIGVGGVDSGNSAFEKIAAGANVVQLYTGMV